MSPELKAKELVDNFYQLFPLEKYVTTLDGDLSWEYKSWEKSKQAAIISVDQTLFVLQNLYFLGETQIYAFKYWQDVKDEIQKL